MRILRIMLAAVAVCALAPKAPAGLVTWEFAGEITSVYDENDLLGGQVGIGTPFSGSFTFESTAADLASGPYTGDYRALVEFLAYVDELMISDAIVPGDGIFVVNGFSSLLPDGFGVRLEGDLLAQRVFINLTLIDESGTVFDNDDLPVVPPDLAAFDRATFIVRSDEELPLLRLNGDITSLVPEPGTLLLLGAAGFALMAKYRARRIPDREKVSGRFV